MKADIAIKDGKEKGRTVHIETTADLSGMKIGEIVHGDKIHPELHGFELEITGASDSDGFPYSKDIDGPNRKQLLLKRGKGMHDKVEGLRKKKSMRGNTLSAATAQVNLAVKKHGKKTFEEVFGPQKVKEKKVEQSEEIQGTEIKAAP